MNTLDMHKKHYQATIAIIVAILVAIMLSLMQAFR